MKDIPTSPRIIEIRHNRRVRKLRLSIIYFILFIVIIGALSFFLNNRSVILNKVVITGTHIIDQEDIEKEVFKNIFGKYIYLFSKSNSFIYPNKKIYNNLLLNFPRIETLSVRRDNLNTIHIDITERKGSYLYCGSMVPENKDEIGDNCYFINNDGFIFDKAPYFSGNVYFKYYIPLDEDIINPQGKQMVSIERFHEIMRFIDRVTSLGFKPIYIYLDKNGSYSLYLEHVNGGTYPRIIFKDNNELSLIEDNLSLAIKKKEFANEINSKYDKLLYIDLCFKNRVLYKFQ
jgi:hypothetical protein